jgi:type IV fimbrial biogenesis protein FimT
MDHTPPYTAGGFTLIELMVTLGIAAILLALAGPSFVDTVTRYRLDAAHSSMRDALLLARETARNDLATVTVCASSSGTACTASSWQLGAIVFVDEDGDGTKDGVDTIIGKFDSFASGISISATVQSSGAAYARTYVQFSREGELDPAYALKFTSCAAGQQPHMTVVQRGGFISTARGDSTCS